MKHKFACLPLLVLRARIHLDNDHEILSNYFLQISTPCLGPKHCKSIATTITTYIAMRTELNENLIVYLNYQPAGYTKDAEHAILGSNFFLVRQEFMLKNGILIFIHLIYELTIHMFYSILGERGVNAHFAHIH